MTENTLTEKKRHSRRDYQSNKFCNIRKIQASANHSDSKDIRTNMIYQIRVFLVTHPKNNIPFCVYHSFIVLCILISKSWVFKNIVNLFVFRYSLHSNTWHKISDMRVPRSSCGVCLMGDNIYIVGGYKDNVESIKTVEVYNPETDTWTRVS